ncbi:PREDICTED: selenoprotein M [Pterocles gutturalis]|uniref:selenoprotein M n=1 Tax=Pterocles gutturalis TaxID=240206 RepID=UPI00052940AB|nr:PREDICTED: selenoprotein M [Pterocles gutturalis]
MKHLPGADPELVLLSHRYEELERIPLSDMTREEINQLVQELGFYRKEMPDAPVPEEFQFAPARPLPTLPPHQTSTTDGKTLQEHDKEEHPDL